MSAKAVVITARTFKCPKGHIWRTTGATSFTFIEGVEGGVVVGSGSLCPICIADFLRQNFSTAEVVEEESNDQG